MAIATLSTFVLGAPKYLGTHENRSRVFGLDLNKLGVGVGLDSPRGGGLSAQPGSIAAYQPNSHGKIKRTALEMLTPNTLVPPPAHYVGGE